MRVIGFVVLAASLALAPLAVEAQQAGKVWRIGIISTSARLLRIADSRGIYLGSERRSRCTCSTI